MKDELTIALREYRTRKDMLERLFKQENIDLPQLNNSVDDKLKETLMLTIEHIFIMEDYPGYLASEAVKMAYWYKTLFEELIDIGFKESQAFELLSKEVK